MYATASNYSCELTAVNFTQFEIRPIITTFKNKRVCSTGHHVPKKENKKK